MSTCTRGSTAMRNTVPYSANDVSVHPPLSQTRVGALAWTVWMSDVGGTAGPVRGAQLAFEDLSRARLRQFVDPRDRTRHLVAREVLASERAHGGLVEIGARSLDDHRVDQLAPVVARDAEHRCFVDVWMRLERRLDLRRVDVHPTRDDHVLLAVADVEEPLVVAVRDVADRLE